MSIRQYIGIVENGTEDRADRLAHLLLAVRQDVLHGRPSTYGDCELVAERFLSNARGEGLIATDPQDNCKGEGEIVLGYRAYEPEWCNRFLGHVPEPGQHQWVEIGGMIYDGAADQFGDRVKPVVVTSANDPRYRVHDRYSRTFMRATPFAKPY